MKFKQYLNDQKCPEGQKWCPIQQKCVTPKGRGKMDEMGSFITISTGHEIDKKTLKKFKKKYKTAGAVIDHIKTRYKLSKRDEEIITGAIGEL